LIFSWGQLCSDDEGLRPAELGRVGPRSVPSATMSRAGRRLRLTSDVRWGTLSKVESGDAMSPLSRSGRGVVAVFLGFVAVVVLSLATDQLFHVLHVYPPWGQPMWSPALNLLALASPRVSRRTRRCDMWWSLG
jgi:hypothetical protein